MTTTETVADVLAKMREEAVRETLGRERDEGYNAACSHWAGRMEAAMSQGEPVAWREDVKTVVNWIFGTLSEFTTPSPTTKKEDDNG
jgi:hypothetical protein